MNIKDFKVGQTVYVELTGNSARGKTKEKRIEEWEITFVGRKYIEAAKKYCGTLIGKTVFEYKESYGRFVQKTNYCVDYILYETIQEIEDKHERHRLFDEVSGVFREYGVSRKLTLGQLRKIKEILDEGEEQNG